MNKKELKKFARDVKAISPVIATLMLVLIAVASASAFYIWQSDWQNENQDNLDDVNVGEGSGTILVSGSTTVTPYLDIAAEMFMEEHPTWKVTVQGIGSSAGILATQNGECDVGMSSKALSTSEISSGLVPILIGYDGVVMFTSQATMNLIGTGVAFDLTPAELRAIYAGNASMDTIGELSVAMGGTSTSTVEIITTDRAEGSGTEEGFCEKLLKDGFKQMPGVGTSGNSYVADHSCTGNQGVIDYVKSTVGAIGFISLGMVSGDSDIVVADINSIEAKTSTIKDATYAGTRPLYVFTNGEPTDMIGIFMEFVTNPGNMYLCCEACGYVPAY